MKRLALFAVALATAGCAFADPAGDPWRVSDETNDPAGDDKADVVKDPTDPVDGPGAVQLEAPSCALEVSQFRETWWVEPALHRFSPNEGLFVTADGFDAAMSVLSVADGEAYAGTNLAGLRAVDRDWSVGVFRNQELGVQIREIATGEVFYETETQVVAADLSADGGWAATVECNEGTIVTLVEVGAGAREFVLEGDTPCYSWGPNRVRAVFTPTADHLIVATVAGRLWSVDTATLATHSIEPHPVPEEPEFYYTTIITDVAMHPTTGEVVTTGEDGTLRRWSVPELEQIGDDIAVGTFRINEMTYAPQYSVSPVAFSPSGETMAHVNVDGDVVLTNAAGEAVLATPKPSDENMQRSPNAPVTIAFSPSGGRVGVGYYWGPGVWGCPGDPIERSGTLSMSAPAVVDLSSGRATIPLQFDGNSPLAAVRARTPDGEEYHQTSFWNGELTVWARHAQPDVETIILEADDGYAAATATIQLRFTQ